MRVSDDFASTIAVTIPILMLSGTVELASLASGRRQPARLRYYLSSLRKALMNSWPRGVPTPDMLS
jgi:hypothetical protein